MAFSNSIVLFFALYLLNTNAETPSSTFHVWPIPKRIEVRGEPVAVAKNFQFIVDENTDLEKNARLYRGVRRFNEYVQNPTIYTLSDDKPVVKNLKISIVASSEDNGKEEYPSIATQYDYNITVRQDGQANAVAFSQYGAFYAMETFLQLMDHNGTLPGSIVNIRDSPESAWRGMMLDAGRRFIPMQTVENILDVMSMVKLNVLHLHASDFCRFGVESKVFPSLTSSLSGDYAGFYSQNDIKNLVEYAADRGIRVVPEFDMPGHSKGFHPLADKGLKFCDKTNSQLYGDPGNSTYNIIIQVLKEMASLFPDDVLHIGADETTVTGPCSLNSTFSFERMVLDEIRSTLKKTPEGWEELLFSAGAATQDSIVNAWSRHRASEVVATGRQAVESHSPWFYFTAPPSSDYPAGWANCWNDIAEGVNATSRHLLLGGEMSMWTDSYCIVTQCGLGTGAPVASSLFPPSMDKEFQQSIGGMIWPRGYVGAGAFWGYNSTIDPESTDFVKLIWNLNDKVRSRGGSTCPTGCTCDQLKQCGKPIKTLL